MSKVTQYAVVDGAVEEQLLEFLAEYNPPHCCLYAEPLQDELISIAPYLIEVNEDVTEWLSDKDSPWGIYLFASNTMKELRQHLRKYLQVLIPIEEKPVFLRFYDPRTIWNFCEILTDWEIHGFLGPVNKIMTVYDGITKEEPFLERRQQFPATAYPKMKLLKINRQQFDRLEQCAEESYIQKLVVWAKQHPVFLNVLPVLEQENSAYLQNKSTINNLVKECYVFCKKHDITDDRSIRGIIQLMMQNHIHLITEMPLIWHNKLTDTNMPGYFRVESLLKEELGYIPR